MGYFNFAQFEWMFVNNIVWLIYQMVGSNSSVYDWVFLFWLEVVFDKVARVGAVAAVLAVEDADFEALVSALAHNRAHDRVTAKTAAALKEKI
jgi:hypothetical protein